jgi:hypothetical protein
MILQILGFACLAHLAAEFFGSINLPEIPDQPFKCNLCMGYWLSVIPFVIQWGLIGFLLAAITGVASETIYKILNRL